MAKEKKIVKLGYLLTEVAGRVNLFGDRVDDVLPVNAREYQELDVRETSDDDIAPALAIIRRVVPSLTEDEIGQLNLKAIGAIFAIAKYGVGEVEEALPNSSGATTETPTPPVQNEPPAT